MTLQYRKVPWKSLLKAIQNEKWVLIVEQSQDIWLFDLAWASCLVGWSALTAQAELDLPESIVENGFRSGPTRVTNALYM